MVESKDDTSKHGPRELMDEAKSTERHVTEKKLMNTSASRFASLVLLDS